MLEQWFSKHVLIFMILFSVLLITYLLEITEECSGTENTVAAYCLLGVKGDELQSFLLTVILTLEHTRQELDVVT